MNVLYIDTEHTWRGGENQLFLLMHGAAKAGLKTHLAVPPDSEAHKRAISQKVMFIYPIKMEGASLPAAIFHLIRYCRRSKIDLIDTQTSKAHNIALAIKTFLPQVKLIVHRRVDYAPSPTFFSRQKYLSNKVDRFVAISHAIRQVLLDYGIEEERVCTIHSAVQSDVIRSLDRKVCHEDVCAAFNLESTFPIISCIAYLTTQKGHPTLLYALRQLVDLGKVFHCLLVGDGPEREKLEKLVHQLELTRFVTFTGIRTDAPQILRATTILAMPSDYEGLGTTILDALHAGCCVVATGVGGIPEMIIHEKTGLLSEKADSRQFALNLMRVIDDPEFAAKLALAGRSFIEQKFTVNHMVAENIKVYQQLLDRVNCPA